MNGLTAADFADTGQWRLILNIFPTGMKAHLENTLHPDLEPQLLFTTEWEADGSSLLRNIENAVYDHPRVLDDFSAKIIVYDRRVVFMPTALMEETEGAEESCFTALYDASPEDVMTESDDDITVAYAPAKGLKGFINRTFPGARVGCNLMDKLKQFRRREDGERLYVEVRENEADFLLLDGEKLLSASTHSWNAGSDIVYHGFNLMDVYSVTPKDTRVFLGGEKIPEDVRETFTRFCAAVE